MLDRPIGNIPIVGQALCVSPTSNAGQGDDLLFGRRGPDIMSGDGSSGVRAELVGALSSPDSPKTSVVAA